MLKDSPEHVHLANVPKSVHVIRALSLYLAGLESELEEVGVDHDLRRILDGDLK
jgi:hypothetical protein